MNTAFRKIWAASAVSGLGDGMTMVAGPLLVLTLTRDPSLVAGAAFAGQLPYLLLSLHSGAYVDRIDRQRLMVRVNLLRGAVVGALAVSVWLGVVSIPVVYAVAFLLGTGETLAGNAAGAYLPSLVPADDLPRANSRLMAVYVLGNQIAAKPIGGLLFGVAAALPFGVDAATFVFAAAMVATIRVPVAALRVPTAPDDPQPPTSLRRDIAEGVRWLARHRRLRALALCVGGMNLFGAGTFALWALLARERLGLGSAGYGLLLVGYAVGGFLGTLVASRLAAVFGAGTVLRAGLVVEGGAQLVLALTRSPWLAGGTLVLFGMHAMVWGVLAVSVRQRVVPEQLRGRVGSVYSLLDVGGAALGTLLGGAVAHLWGVTAPFLVAAAGMPVLILAVWREL